jgi:hypothetical protein
MILKGNQRGNGRELANHLMRGKENEHIELHELRGFAAEDLHGAMQECEAIAKGTRCKNHPFPDRGLDRLCGRRERAGARAFAVAAGGGLREGGAGLHLTSQKSGGISRSSSSASSSTF